MVQPEIPTSQIQKKKARGRLPSNHHDRNGYTKERSMCTDTGLIWTIVIQSHPKSRVEHGQSLQEEEDKPHTLLASPRR
jgi:hypothetical protein